MGEPTPVEPITEPTVPVTEPEPETKEGEGIIFGLSALSLALIIGGVLLLAALAAASVFSFMKRKGENVLVTGTPQNKIKPNETARDEEQCLSCHCRLQHKPETQSQQGRLLNT